MGTSVISSNVATWLELAVAPHWRRDKCRIRVHAISGYGDNCYAISMDERWLCVGQGRPTIFHGLSAALHLLKTLRIENFEPGDPTSLPPLSAGDTYCLRLDGTKGIQPCGCARTRRTAAH
ncbi:hypothetical protein [Aromatoleum evansii]|uniref:hypothetical protein n=1 Tax=Aromatoleum evansii TaxID=59406 RepID=UPI00145C8498|nr:hypothetical protein [Aromatoleum evansii]NMG31614.1 hypothetical protein [Aromatoleum evansii]